MKPALLLFKTYTFFRYSFWLFFQHPLWNRFRAFIPFTRFLRLQISFLFKSKIYVPWFQGVILPLERGLCSGLSGNYYFGLHEFVEMGFIIHVLEADDIFVDIGSNLGSYSILAAKLCKVKSCMAFEPDPATFHRLSEVIQINQLIGTISAFNVALGDTYGSAFFSCDRDTMNHVVSPDYHGNKSLVSLSLLDSFPMAGDNIIVKLDVEGFEFNVLSGSVALLGSGRILCLIMEGFDSQCCQLLRSQGYVPFTYDVLNRKLIEIFKPNSRILNGIWIASSKLTTVEFRLGAAPSFRLFGNCI